MVIKFIKKKFKIGKKPMDEGIIEQKKKLISKLVNGKEARGPLTIKTSIKDIMSTDLKTLKPNDNIGYVLELFSEYSITGAPVIDKGKAVGILSQTDIINLMNEKKLFDPQTDEVKINQLQNIKIKDFMSKNIFFMG